MCRPAAVIDQSGGGLHHHQMLFVWRPAAGVRAEMDRTNEMPVILGSICGFDAELLVSKKHKCFLLTMRLPTPTADLGQGQYASAICTILLRFIDVASISNASQTFALPLLTPCEIASNIAIPSRKVAIH